MKPSAEAILFNREPLPRAQAARAEEHRWSSDAGDTPIKSAFIVTERPLSLRGVLGASP